MRALYEAYQARDWASAAALLRPDATLEMPATREHMFGRDEIMRFQAGYPEPWGDLRVLRALGAGDGRSVVAEVEIISADEVFRCAAFWTADRDGLAHGVEYWVTIGGDRPGPR